MRAASCYSTSRADRHKPVTTFREGKRRDINWLRQNPAGSTPAGDANHAMAVRYTPESARRLTRKDRAHRATRWALVGGIAVVLVGGSAGLVGPVAGVIAAVATAVVLISATLGRDLAIVRADLSEQRALLALAPLREGLVYPGNPAALCPENALFVIQQIYQRRPQRVVEF